MYKSQLKSLLFLLIITASSKKKLFLYTCESLMGLPEKGNTCDVRHLRSARYPNEIGVTQFPEGSTETIDNTVSCDAASNVTRTNAHNGQIRLGH